MKTVASHALGCKVNQYESSAIAELFLEKGYKVVNIESEADIYIINTCSVTNFGDKKSRQLIRKVKRQNPQAIVAVVGCYAQTSPKEVMDVEGVNLVLGTKDRNHIVEFVEEYDSSLGVKNYVTKIKSDEIFEPLSISKLSNRTRAYLKIQDGCSQFCSYCIIPYARGPIRSRKPKDVLHEVNVLSKNGFLEVVLAGIHVASYGLELENVSLLTIIQDVSKTEGIKRIRFSSIEPNIITQDFVKELKKLSKVCDHFHLSLQSGCDKTLKEMNRKYDTKKYKEAVLLLRSFYPNVAITTDIIVGFPGETDQDFLQTCNFAKEMEFAKIHVFPYSPKKGTQAAKRSDQLNNDVKSNRSRILTKISDDLASDFMNKLVSQTVSVLYEKEVAKNIYEGYTTNYVKVHAFSHNDLKNCIADTLISKAEKDFVLGTVI